jgi:hypothetical protein
MPREPNNEYDNQGRGRIEMDLGGAVDWIQSQPNIAKYAISFGVVIIAAILIIIL